MQRNYHVILGEDYHQYSVPFALIGKKLKLVYTAQTVEIYDSLHRVAIHQRNYRRYGYTTLSEHMPPHHRREAARRGWNADYFKQQALQTGTATHAIVERILESRAFPEQTYNSCLGIMERCTAHDNGTGNTHCGGPGGIWAWDCNNITIQYCESYHNSGGKGCDGLGFDFDGGITNSTMQYNYSHDNDGPGYLLGQYDYARPWYNNVVRYNISENDARTNNGAITLFKGPETTMTGAELYHNTVYVSPSISNVEVACFAFLNWNTGIDSTVIYNNIFQATGNAYLVNIPAGYNARFAGNLYWTAGGTFKIQYQGTIYNNLADWRSATGNETLGVTPTGIVSDPLLTNAGTGGTMYPALTYQLNAYQLPAHSAAVNMGLDIITLFGTNPGVNDFFNNPAAVGTADIGACESPIPASLEPERYHNRSISLYPNPASTEIKIDAPSKNILRVEIFNESGESVMTTLNKNCIDVSKIVAGIYFIKAKDGDSNYSLKFIKE